MALTGHTFQNFICKFRFNFEITFLCFHLLWQNFDWLRDCGLMFLFGSRVMCNCGSCGSKKQTLSEWERHTGCRAKKWKYSVRVKSTMLPLENWVCFILEPLLAYLLARYLIFLSTPGTYWHFDIPFQIAENSAPSIYPLKLDKQQLLTFLGGEYMKVISIFIYLFFVCCCCGGR